MEGGVGANLRKSGYNKIYEALILMMIPLIAVRDPNVWKSTISALLLSIVMFLSYRRKPVRYMLIPAFIVLIALLAHIALLLI